jgi:hypothetical protein
MRAFEPNAYVSPLAERIFGFGLGLFLAALIIGDGTDAKDSIVSLIGAGLVISSMIASIIIKRRQIAASRSENLKALTK